MDEREIVERAGKGDEDAFEQLVTAYESMVYNLSLRMTGDRDEAFDLTQETFLKAWHAVALFQFDCKFSTWLCRIASNTCIDHLRRQRRHPTLSLTALDEENIPYERAIADSSQDPAGLLEQVLDREMIDSAMKRLPPDDRLILSLRAIDGMSYAEIGEAMALKAGTVKSRLARAREKMRRLLDGNFSEKASSDSGKGGARR